MDDHEDDDNFVVFGSALEPLEEDEAVIRKKPVHIQDQVVTDEQGRRRFHGAFTGGFSAGYYNTVGSKEGWAPSTFKSTRNERTSFKNQSAQDFMDDEDKGSFGIAPQILRPTEEFSSSKNRESLKRARPTQSEGPIPGDPVLHQIIQPVIETVGVKVLKKLGWRPGQGIGPKISRKTRQKQLKEKNERMKKKEDKKVEEEEEQDITGMEIDSTEKRYGCSLPPKEMRRFLKPKSDEEEDTDDDEDDENLRPLLVAPKDIDSPLCKPKENQFGLGYKGLDRNALGSSHVDLFGPALKFKVEDKKMNITGEAFGIGAFEEEDEEVYSRDDMTQYDFALETTQERKQRLLQESRKKRKAEKGETKSGSIPGFIRAKKAVIKPKYFPPPSLPPHFEPIHVGKKSRFSIPAQTPEQDKNTQSKKLGLDRHQLTREERQILIEDEPKPRQIESQSLKPFDKKLDLTSFSSIPSTTPNLEEVTISIEKKDSQERIDRLKKFTDVLQAFSSKKSDVNSSGTSDKGFKPFMKNPLKQERYDKFLTLKAAGYGECLKDLQPPEMTEWEREREKMEFERAAALFKPMAGEMSSRFVSAKSHDISHIVPEREKEMEKDATQDPLVAAKMNLFGKLTHKVLEWNPDRIVCKRFNVPPPYPDSKVVGVRSGTSGRQERETKESKESIATKKSLFDDLDFSKPPPGLLPVGDPLHSISSSSGSASASTSASSQQIDVHADNVLDSSITFLSRDHTDDDTKTSNSLPKPPLDLFKEIFADTSSESEQEEEEEEVQDSDKNKHKDNVTLSKNVSKSGGGDDRDPRHLVGDKHLSKVVEAKRERRWDNQNPSTKSKELLVSKQKEEENLPRREEEEKQQGIFHNLDFSKLMPPFNPTSPSVSSSLPSVSPSSTKTGSVLPQVSKMFKPESLLAKGQDEEPINDEYGPAPPLNIQKMSSSADLASSQIKRPYSYSSSSSSVFGTSGSASSQMEIKKKKDEIMWVEKDQLEDSSVKSKRSSSKKHSKKKKIRKSRHSSKSKKAKKHKSSSRHKSSSKSKKRARESPKSERKHGHRDKSESSSSETDSENSSDDSENGVDYTKLSSTTTMPISSSQNSRAIKAKLKEMLQ